MKKRNAAAHGLCGLAPFLLAALLFQTAHAAETVRLYPCGEDDPDGEIDETLLETVDIQSPPAEDADGAPVADALGEFVTLTAAGNPLYVEGRAADGGEAGLAIEFDGVDDTLTSGAYDPRNFSSFAALSQAWVKPDPDGEGVRQAVWSLGNDNGGVGISATGKWEMIAISIIADTASNADVEFGAWTHVAVLRGGNGSELYVNGALVAAGEGFWNGVGNVTVGNRTNPAGDTSFFHGAIDDFQIAGFSDFAFDPLADIKFFEGPVSDVFGDINGDRLVNGGDFVIWSDNVGFDNGLGGGDGNTLLMGDIDQNGRVDYFDFRLLAQEAGTAVEPTPSAAGAIAADDFFYDQPTKILGPGGGFNLQSYGGGQGAWTGLWVSVGNGIVTGASDADGEQFMGFTAIGLSANSLNRTFSLTGLPASQTVYFSALVKARTDQSAAGRFVLNAPGDELSEISIGFDSTFGFDAKLGAAQEFPVDAPVLEPGEFHRIVAKLEINGSGDNEVLSAWLDPDDEEGGDVEIFVEADVVASIEELTGQLVLDRGTAGGGPLLWDDVAVGTSWESVTTIAIPRLAVQVDKETGDVTLVNSTQSDVDVKYYELVSESGSLDPVGWSSFADEPLSSWRENNPTPNRLTESIFTGSRTITAGRSVSLGAAFTPGSDQDLVVRIATTTGLLNLALGDRDEDTILDPDDNCVNLANAGQEDGDGDGIGDVCDNCPGLSNRDQIDLDGDGVGNACDTEIADTVRDWSPTGEQGANNMYYGYFDVSEDIGLGGDGTYDPDEFIEFLNDGSGVVTPDPFLWRDGVNHWNGASWELAAGGPPWTSLGRLDLHPSDPDPESEHWIVRRWESDRDARVTVLWHMHHQNVSCGGNGVGGLLYHNDTLLDEAAVAGGDDVGVTRSVEISVSAGDTLDLLLTPIGLDGVDDDGCDGSQNWFLVGPADGGDVAFRRGDPDNSGAANITDAIGVLNFLFAGGTPPLCSEAADINDDGQVNISDPVSLLNFLFGGGTAPAAPGSETCGPDPAESPAAIGCETYTTCG